VDVINRATIGTIDFPLPVPKAVRIQIINRVTCTPILQLLFTPNDITHSTLLLVEAKG
jgi:hypothetical protein